MTYRVERAPLTCATVTAGDFVQVGGDIVDGFSYSDTAALADGPYCYYVQADDLVAPANSNQLDVTVDKTAPVVTGVTHTGGDGCTAAFTVTNATVTDASVVALTGKQHDLLGGIAVHGSGESVRRGAGHRRCDGRCRESLTALRHPRPARARCERSRRHGLEVTTDPAGQKATLNWTPSVNDGAPVTYKLRTKGPQGVANATFASGPVVVPDLQVDATYEFTLEPVDACSRSGGTSVRLVRLNDTSPPTMPDVADPVFNPVSHIVALTWSAATDNIQVDHYEILRNGVPIGATDSTAFVDVAPIEHAQLSYVVRAVDTNGNSADSAARDEVRARLGGSDRSRADRLHVRHDGDAALERCDRQHRRRRLRRHPRRQADREHDLVRAHLQGRQRAGRHARLAGARARRRRPHGHLGRAAAAGREIAIARERGRDAPRRGGKTAARYSLKARARLLIDLRVIGTINKATLRLYVSSGRTRITLWRGIPGTSAPRLRLGSAVARRGLVSIKLDRALHAGRIRLVLIPSGKIVIVGKGAHEPTMKAG